MAHDTTSADVPVMRCSAPRVVYFGATRGTTRCGQCKLCRRHRSQQWVLRCLMELETSQAKSLPAWVVTFTYRDGEPGAQQFCYDDMQRCFKRLRKAGHRFRYLVTAERGKRSTKRIHFHALIFWQGPPPKRGPVVGRKPVGDKVYAMHAFAFWPHGHTVIDDCTDRRSIRYVVKYVTKEAQGDEGLGRPRFSQKPALGGEWLQADVEKRAVAGVPRPRNYFSVQGHNYGVLPVHWKRWKLRFLEIAGQFSADFSAFPRWRDVWLGHRPNAVKAALVDWPIVPSAIRSRPVWVNGRAATLHVTARSVALEIGAPREWSSQSLAAHSRLALDPEYQAARRSRAASLNAPIPFPPRWPPCGVYPLERGQVRQVLNGELPVLSPSQIARQWTYLPDRLLSHAPAMRLAAAVGLASSSDPFSRARPLAGWSYEAGRDARCSHKPSPLRDVRPSWLERSRLEHALPIFSELDLRLRLEGPQSSFSLARKTKLGRSRIKTLVPCVPVG